MIDGIRAALREAVDFVDCNPDASDYDLYEVVSGAAMVNCEPGSLLAKAVLTAYEDSCAVYWSCGEVDDEDRKAIAADAYTYYFGL